MPGWSGFVVLMHSLFQHPAFLGYFMGAEILDEGVAVLARADEMQKAVGVLLSLPLHCSFFHFIITYNHYNPNPNPNFPTPIVNHPNLFLNPSFFQTLMQVLCYL